MNLKIITDDNEFQQAVDLRQLILRTPLGLSFSKEEIQKEKSHIHFGLFNNQELLATASLVPEGSACRMQRVAVKLESQGQGLGSMLVKFIEEEAFKQGFKKIYCYARDTARSFYIKHGYEVKGPLLSKHGLPHIEMQKLLGFTVQKSTKEERDIFYNGINDFNAKNISCKNLEMPLNYSIKIDNKLAAGITSSLYFDQILYVAILFVKEKYRNLDLGSFLLNKVENEAKALGARFVHLDTFDFQARDFYLKYGYEIFGTLDNCPLGHKRYYLKKNLLA